MGCVFGRQVSAKPISVEKERKQEEVRAEKTEVEVGEAQNGGNRKDNDEEDKSARPRKRSSRPRPNPRLSNPPKHLQGEQVAAGWPSWLSAVAGEAINGWTPRRADTFEKLDKVIPSIASTWGFFCLMYKLKFFFWLENVWKEKAAKLLVFCFIHVVWISLNKLCPKKIRNVVFSNNLMPDS